MTRPEVSSPGFSANSWKRKSIRVRQRWSATRLKKRRASVSTILLRFAHIERFRSMPADFFFAYLNICTFHVYPTKNTTFQNAQFRELWHTWNEQMFGLAEGKSSRNLPGALCPLGTTLQPILPSSSSPEGLGLETTQGHSAAEFHFPPMVAACNPQKWSFDDGSVGNLVWKENQIQTVLPMKSTTRII